MKINYDLKFKEELEKIIWEKIKEINKTFPPTSCLLWTM